MTTVDWAVWALLQAKQFEKSTGKKDENLSKELADTLLAKDALINEDLATYASNRRLTTPEDPMIEEIEGQIGFGKILEQKAEEEQKKQRVSREKNQKTCITRNVFYKKK